MICHESKPPGRKVFRQVCYGLGPKTFGFPCYYESSQVVVCSWVNGLGIWTYPVSIQNAARVAHLHQ